MKFDDFAANAARAAAAQHVDPPAIAEVRVARRRRSAGSAVFGAFVGTLIIVGAASWWPAGTLGGPPDSVVATAPLASTTTAGALSTTPTPTTTTAAPPSTSLAPTTTAMPEFRVWSIAQPPSWHRADSELMPDLGWNSVTVATFPLRPGGTRCSHMPENALRDLGSRDVLLSIFPGAAGDGAPWPVDGFDDEVFPALDLTTDAHECSDRSDLEVHWGAWETGGQGSYLLAVFGDAVSEDARREAWATLSSLSAVAVEGTGPMCVVTVPPEPMLAVPDTHPEEPVFGRWYGTHDLWTVLETDGSYGIRKSVWWSANFPGGAVEERPEVLVTWRRLDREESELTNDLDATNAYTAEDGWFMIAGIDPEERGCWEITATYKGASLSYVAVIR
jgi:hypothetical protein